MSQHQARFQAIGTEWSIQASGGLSDASWSELLHAVKQRIAEFDQNYSRFREDSLVTRISKQAGSYPLPSDAAPMLDFYTRLYAATQGKVTPLIGQTMVEAGYDAGYSLQPKTLHRPPRLDVVLHYTAERLTVSEPVLLDFGAAGKGYLVDTVAEILEAAGIEDYVINGGGDIRQRSVAQEALEVGMENPRDTSEAIGVARLTNASLCASAGSRRKWGAFHHIIDPETLQSPGNILASWVIASDTMTADGLATALFFASPAELQKHFSFSYAVLDADMRLTRDASFPLTVFEAAQI